MQVVSSNITLILKVFIPTFWLVVFGLFGGAIWVADYDTFGSLAAPSFRWGYTAFFFIFAALLFFTIMNLKRVEMDSEGIYVTNYFKHFRYPWKNIEKIIEAEFPFVRVVTVVFKESGNFGKKIYFIPSKKRFQQFLVANPEVSKALWEKETAN